MDGFNIKKAEYWIKRLEDYKGGDQEECHYFQSMIEYKYKKDYDKAVYHARKIIEVNPTRYAEMMNFIGGCWAAKGDS